MSTRILASRTQARALPGHEPAGRGRPGPGRPSPAAPHRVLRVGLGIPAPRGVAKARHTARAAWFGPAAGQAAGWADSEEMAGIAAARTGPAASLGRTAGRPYARRLQRPWGRGASVPRRPAAAAPRSRHIRGWGARDGPRAPTHVGAPAPKNAIGPGRAVTGRATWDSR